MALTGMEIHNLHAKRSKTMFATAVGPERVPPALQVLQGTGEARLPRPPWALDKAQGTLS